MFGDVKSRRGVVLCAHQLTHTQERETQEKSVFIDWWWVPWCAAVSFGAGIPIVLSLEE